MSVTAIQILGLPEDSSLWAAKFNASASAFHRRWYNSTEKGYCLGSQTANVMALYLGAVPPSLVSTVVNSLVTDIRRNNNHTTSGIVGETFVFDVLVQYGYGDVALALLLRDDFPSFGYMASKGATTVWENWVGSQYQQDGSWNHIMEAGGVGKFTYTGLAGIDTEVNATHAGFRHILFRPIPPGIEVLRSARATVETRFGTASISWKVTTNSTIVYNITIPPGATAEVAFPRELFGMSLTGILLDGLPSSNLLQPQQRLPMHILGSRELELPFFAVAFDVAGPVSASFACSYTVSCS